MNKYESKVQFKGVLLVWQRNFKQFRKTWLVSFFWIILEPTFFLIAIGYGLGAYVSNTAGVPYSEFFFPALICNTAMMVAFFESTYGNFSKLTYQRTYHTMILTPLDPSEIVLGEIFWAASKGTISAIGVSIVATIFGINVSWMLIPLVMFSFIVSLMFSALGMLVTTKVKNFDSIIYPTSKIIIPLSLFSNTYFLFYCYFFLGF